MKASIFVFAALVNFRLFEKNFRSNNGLHCLLSPLPHYPEVHCHWAWVSTPLLQSILAKGTMHPWWEIPQEFSSVCCLDLQVHLNLLACHFLKVNTSLTSIRFFSFPHLWLLLFSLLFFSFPPLLTPKCEFPQILYLDCFSVNMFSLRRFFYFHGS